MAAYSTLQLLRGPFSFLRGDPEELRRVMPDADRIMPIPQKIFLAREEATPLVGFPILINQATNDLRQALEDYIQAEEALQVALLSGRSPDHKGYERAWGGYRDRLAEATENAMAASFGRRYPSILWLYHSIAVSRLLKETPKRLLRLDLKLGREKGDELKYRTFDRFVDRVMTLTYDVVRRVSEATGDEEKDIFPSLLERMRDNVLALTEDHLSPDLGELKSYFHGYLRLDASDLLQRLEATLATYRRQAEGDPDLRNTVDYLLGDGAASDYQSLLNRPGFLTFLSGLSFWDSRYFLSSEEVAAWERLLLRLKEFEILVAARRLVVPVHQTDGRLTCSSPAGRGTPMGGKQIDLSPSTRPLDFMTSWVQDPLIHRFGLIYDISDFSAIIAVLGRASTASQDASFAHIFRFQRWVNQMARQHRLTLEKYLGDGALYSGRHPRRLLAAAIHLQRFYRRSLEEGFPFDRGLRIALNYGGYRLLPVEEGGAMTTRSYEFFGHGVVELSRLVTGKSPLELDEIKTFLLGLGYSAADVDRFFAPVIDRDGDFAVGPESGRPFFAYLNSTGTLINEGIVATEAFLAELEQSVEPPAMSRYREGTSGYVVVTVDEGSGEVRTGIRRLGVGRFKGLGGVTIYEIVDGEEWPEEALEELPEGGLLEHLAREALPAESSSSTT